ncbi:MAG TPA: tetratricopeptide repeat protein [Anaerolineaceae bacterium]|nr:tetratricopeptide repeat protein [Anaerolineaceae bacterium]
MEQIFIAREEQLKQLGECLAQAVSGQGRVCFVSGEAGSGKTTLVQEFVRRAQEGDKDLAVAVGLCDAQSGIGDAYLPFREVLGQLTGDVDAKLAQGAITKENAGRLKNMLVLAGQAIVDVGPDLIGVFVPGVGLVTKLGAFVAEKVGWLDKLEKLVNKPKAKPGESGIQESHIFEQYANVLCRIAEKHPLLIILDDLHWGDAASINLLFHLGRRIGQHRILILGTYRSAEVAIGRGGERHPLEKVLAEFKRYFGDVTIDLDKAVEEEGRQFVEAFLESEPNNLKDDFITNLYHHTGGHPLFTVELLRNMQERGDLIKENDKWVESQSLNWVNLPTRVEGVIEERIGRLEEALKQLLTIGSVQGEDFTAEVVARVQQAEAGGLIRKLSGELERQHRLVHSEGIRRLDPGGQRLSLFRFQHNLFRTYLYNEMSEAERAYLHEDVGSALEALFGDQADEIAVQLALHFEKAGLDEKTRYYLQKAGEQAAARYANEEAIAYFTRALELTPEDNFDKKYDLLLLREKICVLKGERELQKNDLVELLRLAINKGDNLELAEVYFRKAQFAQATGDFNEVIENSQKMLNHSHQVGNRLYEAKAHLAWGIASTSKGENESAKNHLEKALEISLSKGLEHEESLSLRGLASLARHQSNFTKAMDYCDKALALAEKIDDRLNASKILIILGNLHSDLGNEGLSKDCYLRALPVLEEVGSRPNMAILLGNLGCTYANQGDYTSALPYFEQARKISQEVGEREMECVALGNLGELSACLGKFSDALDYLEQALRLNQEIGFRYSEMIVLNTMGSIFINQGEFSRAKEILENSLAISRELSTLEWEVKVLTKVGILHDCLGAYAESQEYYKACLNITGKIDIKSEEDDVWTAQGLLQQHQMQLDLSKESLLKAIEICKNVNDKGTECNALLYLGNIQVEMGNLFDAKEAYYSSIELWKQLGQLFLTNEPKAGLARVALQEGKLDEALGFVEQIMDFLKDHNLDGTNEPMRIYLTCYQVLQAAGDPRADEILTQAHAILMERANKITDEAMRTSYLENVAANRQIVDIFLQKGKVTRKSKG